MLYRASCSCLISLSAIPHMLSLSAVSYLLCPICHLLPAIPCLLSLVCSVLSSMSCLLFFVCFLRLSCSVRCTLSFVFCPPCPVYHLLSAIVGTYLPAGGSPAGSQIHNLFLVVDSSQPSIPDQFFGVRYGHVYFVVCLSWMFLNLHSNRIITAIGVLRLNTRF